MLLLALGVAGFIGTVLIGSSIRKSVYLPLMIIPLVMAAIASGLHPAAMVSRLPGSAQGLIWPVQDLLMIFHWPSVLSRTT